MTPHTSAPRRRYGVRARLFSALLAVVTLAVALPASAHFDDTFTRADGAAIGNGWIEKNPGAFSIAGGRASKLTVGTGYRDNLVYRPASEDVLNVEAAVEIQFNVTTPGYPQLAVRVQSATVGNADVLDGYLLYVNNSGSQVILGRQNGNAFVSTLATLALSEALNTTDRYRLRLAARGTNPVQLDAYIERLSAGIWLTVGQANIADAAANRIATAGTVGFGGYTEASYAFDNFVRVDLGATGTANPAPTTNGISPAQVNAGESGLVVVVYGSGFTTDSIARWNGAARPTVYISPSELEASITTADIANPGTGSVTVANPTPGGGTSNAQTFTVTNPGNPPPAIGTLTPANLTAGAAAFTLQVQGSGFDASSTVRWNGANRATTFVSSTRLDAAISAADVANPGSIAVTVARASDGATSPAATFTVSPSVVGDFFDDFNRADNAAIGNGWLEKNPDAFSIVGNEAAKTGAGNDYRNNIIYRPANEDLADAEAIAEFRLTSTSVGYPQIFVRAQPGTITGSNQLDAYLLYLNASTTQAVLARQRGTAYDTALANLTLSSALNATDRYRMRLRATGTNPVQLGAFIERWNGTAWQILGQASGSDTATERIAGAGSVGIGGYTETNIRYDNFSRTNLGSGTNPAPVATSLNPQSTPAGSSAFVLTVNGSNFVNGSVVRWNGANRTTNFVSGTQLTASIGAADVAAQGTANVSVFTGTPGGGTSANLTFTITAPLPSNPVPVATSLSPTQATAGSPQFTLTVNGSSFINGSVVRWNGANRTTTFVSATQLTATIPAADITAAGSATVTVFNPTPGGGTSGGLTFAINPANNPVPTVSSLSPTSTPAGGPAFTLTVNGTNFVGGSVVRWNGSNRTTTFVSATQLTAAISAGDIASQGTRSVSVFNPTPGGGTSGNLTFTISAPSQTNPAPVLTSMSPLAWPTGGGAFTLTVNGSGFNSQSAVHINGTARATTLFSANELRATVNANDVVAAGPIAVTVFNPTPGGGRSVPLTLLVQDGSAQYFIDNFNRADGSNIGNNWTEKDPSAFALQNSEVVSFDTVGGFPHVIMYRPPSEARQNIEAAVEFRRLPNGTSLEESNYPQIHARVQTATVGTPGSLDSYIFFIDDVTSGPRRAMFAINVAPQPGVRYECYMQGVPLTEDLVVGDRYRLRFRVMGTAPVVLWGAVDRFVNGSWGVIGSGTMNHDVTTQRDPNLVCDGPTMPPPITTAGVTGLAKWVNRTDIYDNFYWRDSSSLDPAPTIGSLSPSSAAAGSAGFTLTVNGTGFRPDSMVRWNGANRATTFVSTTQLLATINTADVALAGPAMISVTSDLAQSSSEFRFNITPPSGAVSFDDSFNRADNATVGNGWIEKSPAVFGLGSNRLQRTSAGNDYRNHIVYRPAAEDQANVEALLEFRVEQPSIGYPQIVTRLQQATAGTNNGFQGYLLFMDSSATNAALARQDLGSYEVRLANFTLSQALVVGGTYRMRLATTGTGSMVTLQGAIERLNGGVWTLIGQGTANDTSGSRITASGAVGFGGHTEASYTYDNFRRTNLP